MTTVYKTPVIVPPDARPCRRCTVRMPVPGIVAVSRRDPGLCSECAGEGPAQPLNPKEAKRMTQKTPSTPRGWGDIERSDTMPRPARYDYPQLLSVILQSAGVHWQRIKAPDTKRAQYIRAKILRAAPNMQASVRSMGNEVYLYYRKTEANNAAD